MSVSTVITPGAGSWALECQRCGMVRPGLREVVRPHPQDDRRELHLRLCGPCRGEREEPSTDETSAGSAELAVCPSCEQEKPAADWGPGLIGLGGRVGRVCVDCQPPKPADPTTEFPRFAAVVTLEPGQRRICAGELLELAGGHPVLVAIADQLSAAGDRHGPVTVDLDVSALSLADRSRIGLALEAAVQYRHPSVHAVRRVWLDWLRPQLPDGKG